MEKCFGVRPNLSSAAQIINDCVHDQEGFFQHFGLNPVRLGGKRRLHAIDCQNLFCETDKYARVAHPQFNLARSAIMQTLKPTGPLPQPFFAPKWGI